MHREGDSYASDQSTKQTHFFLQRSNGFRIRVGTEIKVSQQPFFTKNDHFKSSDSASFKAVKRAVRSSVTSLGRLATVATTPSSWQMWLLNIFKARGCKEAGRGSPAPQATATAAAKRRSRGDGVILRSRPHRCRTTGRAD